MIQHGRRTPDAVGAYCPIILAHKPGERRPHWETLVCGMGWAPPYMGRVRVLEAGQRATAS